MENRVFWWAGALLVLVLLVWRRRDVAGLVRGLRNNNPGNVREPRGDSTEWVGERATDDDPAFEEFTEMKFGVRAALVVFRNYQRKYGLRTIEELIARWAPPTENDTEAYIESVVTRAGIARNIPLNLSNEDIAARFLRAVFQNENGLPAESISDATIREGIRLAA